MEPYLVDRKVDHHKLTIDRQTIRAVQPLDHPVVAWIGSNTDELQWSLSRLQRMAAVHCFENWNAFASATEESSLRFNRLLIAPSWRDPGLLNQIEQWQIAEPLVPLAMLFRSHLEGARRTWLPLSGPLSNLEFFYWYQIIDRLKHWIGASSTTGRLHRRPPSSLESRTDRWFYCDIDRTPINTRVILVGCRDALSKGWSEACLDRGITVKILDEQPSCGSLLDDEMANGVSGQDAPLVRVWFYYPSDSSVTWTPATTAKTIAGLRSQSDRFRFGLISRRIDWATWQTWLEAGIDDLLVPPFRIDGLWLS